MRERSSGPNIHDTEKIVLSKNSDGKVRKRLVLETVATITTRTRRKSGSDAKGISNDTRRKRSKTVDNILNHVSENKKENKAKIISTIIDGEGKDFAKLVKISYKKSQENESLTVAETNSLQMGTRSSEYLWRQTRSAFLKTFGYSPLASAKKVDI